MHRTGALLVGILWNHRRVERAPWRWTERALALGTMGVVVSTPGLWLDRQGPPAVLALWRLGVAPAVIVMLGAAVVLKRPRLGAVVLLGGLLGGVMSDRLRLQPEIVWFGAVAVGVAARSRVIVLSGTAAALGLAALWAWVSTLAGTRSGRSGLTPGRPVDLDERLVVAGAMLFALVAAGLLFRRTRWAATVGATPIMVSLGALAARDRPTWLIWAVAVGVVLFERRRDQDRAPAVAGVAAAFTIGAAALWGFGLVDAGSAMHLYSTVAARADVCSPVGACRPFGPEVHRTTGAHVPAQASVYRALFRETCRSGDWLVIAEPLTLEGRRPWAGRCP